MWMAHQARLELALIHLRYYALEVRSDTGALNVLGQVAQMLDVLPWRIIIVSYAKSG